MPAKNNVAATWDELHREELRRLARCASHAANEMKKTVSVPAPRKKAKKSGRVYATVKATPGAPPRKLTGRGRAGIAWRLIAGELASEVGINVFYMGRHERENHKWVKPTLDR